MTILQDISYNALSNVRSNMAIGTSNQSSDIIRTSGWSASADAVNFDSVADELSLCSWYNKAPLCDGVFAVRDAVSGLISKAGNCGYMSALALKFIAEDAKFKGMTAKRKYFCEPFQHTFLEISDNENIVYCDPWLNQTFHSIEEIVNCLFIIEKAHVTRLQSVVKHSQFENFTPFDLIDIDSLGSDILEKLECNFTAYCHENSDWAIAQAKISLEDKEGYITELFNCSGKIKDFLQYLQDDSVANSYCFTLSDTNKTQFIALFEFYYSLELKTLYPNQFNLHRHVLDMLEKTKPLQNHGEDSEKTIDQLYQWLEKNAPKQQTCLVPMFADIINRSKVDQYKTKPHKENCCLIKPGFIIARGKMGLFVGI